MRRINEIMDEMSELRSKAQSATRESDAMWTKVRIRNHEIATNVLDYWVSNGGFEGKYFKAPYYCQDWDTMNLPASRHSDKFIRIDKFLFTGELEIHFCGRTFSLGEDLKVDCSFDDRPNQTIRLNKLHPDNLITKGEFEKAEADYQRRFEEYVNGLIDEGEDISNRIVGFSDGSEVKCYYGTGLLRD